MEKKVGKQCKKCGKQYQMGFNGMGNGLCDNCAGVVRDEKGYAWKPTEDKKTLANVASGEIRVVNRKDALGGTK
jgi:hypothetical protein